MLYMVTFTINIPPMLPYMAYMDPMGTVFLLFPYDCLQPNIVDSRQPGTRPCTLAAVSLRITGFV